MTEAGSLGSVEGVPATEQTPGVTSRDLLWFVQEKLLLIHTYVPFLSLTAAPFRFPPLAPPTPATQFSWNVSLLLYNYLLWHSSSKLPPLFCKRTRVFHPFLHFSVSHSVHFPNQSASAYFQTHAISPFIIRAQNIEYLIYTTRYSPVQARLSIHV